MFARRQILGRPAGFIHIDFDLSVPREMLPNLQCERWRVNVKTSMLRFFVVIPLLATTIKILVGARFVFVDGPCGRPPTQRK